MSDIVWDQLYYKDWVRREGLELVQGHTVHDVYTMPLRPWDRTGGRAAHIQLDGTGELNAAYVSEIGPGGELNPQRHIYEEVVYVLSGHGSTTVWYDSTRKRSFEWGPRSLFAIPMNANYQHFNTSGTEPARYIAVTTAPILMNLIRDERFIFENDAVFPRRFSGDDDYFSGPMEFETFTGFGTQMPVAFGNLFDDIDAVDRGESNRGVDTRSVHFEIGEGTLGAHTVEIPGGTFTKIHRHGPGAHVLWLKGEGYTLMWQDGAEKIQADWKPGSMTVPPTWWWHQHAVVSREPGQHLALKLGSRRYKINSLSKGTMKSTREGGSQMEYEDFPPELMTDVRQRFQRACDERGTPIRMEPSDAPA